MRKNLASRQIKKPRGRPAKPKVKAEEPEETKKPAMLLNLDLKNNKEIFRLLIKFENIHDFVVDSKKRIDVHWSKDLNHLFQSMRKVWLSVMKKSHFHYRKMAATSLLDFVFKGSVQFTNRNITVGRKFALDTDNPKKETLKHTARYFDDLLIVIDR